MDDLAELMKDGPSPLRLNPLEIGEASKLYDFLKRMLRAVDTLTGLKVARASMDRPGDSQRPPPEEQQDEQPVKVVPPSYRTLYLICYNCVSALLWSVVLGRTLVIAGIHGPNQVYLGTGQWTKWTQTLAGLEILHAAIGTLSAVKMPATLC